jgi:chorismate mutase
MLNRENINKIREEIDQIDSLLVSLLESRIELVHSILELKKIEDLDVLDEEREHLIIERIGRRKTSPEIQVALMRIFRSVLDWGVKSYSSSKTDFGSSQNSSYSRNSQGLERSPYSQGSQHLQYIQNSQYSEYSKDSQCSQRFEESQEKDSLHNVIEVLLDRLEEKKSSITFN